MSSREEKLVKNSIILSIGTFLPKLAAFVTLPILTKCLLTEEFGVYDLITVLVSLVLPAATLQIQTAAFRFLIDRRDDEYETKKIITNIYAFIVPVSVLALVIMFVILSFVSGALSVTTRLLICLYFFADILVNAARQIVRGLANNMDYSISAIISAIGKMVFAVVAVYWLDMGLDGAILALAASSTFSFIYLILKTRIFRFFDFSLVSSDTLKELLHYSWPMVPNTMSMWIMRVSDRFVIALSPLGTFGNGLYGAANKIPQLLQIAQSTFSMAWQENASIYSKDKDINKYYSSMFKTMFNLMAGFLGALLAAAPYLYQLLISKPEMYEAYPQVPILFLSMFFYSMSTYLGGIYVAYKATLNVGITTMVSAAINLIIDIALINVIGLYAASLSTLISYVFLFLFRMFNVRKLVKLKYDYVHIILVLGIILVECWLCIQSNILAQSFTILIGALAFIVLNFPLIKALHRKFVKLIAKVTKKSKGSAAAMKEKAGAVRVRYNGLDVLKVICAFLIICSHIHLPGEIGGYFDGVSRFSVPCFFMITGFFYINTVKRGRRGKQLKHIFLIFAGSNLFFFAYDIVMLLVNGGNVAKFCKSLISLKQIAKFLIFNVSPFSYHLWYMGAILYVLIIAAIADKLHLRKLLYIMTPVLLIADLCLGKYSMLIFGRNFPAMLTRNFLFVGLPYFCIGMIIFENKDKIERFFRKRKTTLGIFWVAFVMLNIAERYMLLSLGCTSNREQYICTTLSAAAIFILCMITYRREHKGLLKILADTGRKHTMMIYILHPIFITLISAAAIKLSIQDDKYIWITPVLVFFASLAASIVWAFIIRIIKPSGKVAVYSGTKYINAAECGGTDKKPLPELYKAKSECCGCTACAAVCPKDAIKMEEDGEGFLYPTVDASLCIRCYKCTKVCSFKQNRQ